MAASRRLIIGSTFFHIHQTTLSPTKPSLSISKTLIRNLYISTKPTTPLPSLITPFLKPHFTLKYTTSSVSIDTLNDNFGNELTPISSSSLASHPWPEWVNFVEKLKVKGFLNKDFLPVEDDEDSGGGGGDGGAVSTSKKELNLLRNACLSFARERFDIYKSLSREHIEAVVECGCPSLFRKAVNSAKRLRATLRLDEGDVCSACNLRGSCDKAYGILQDNEASARTVDIVRMLLIYALDPLVLSGGEKPHGREHIEASARKLLSELSELSETPTDPALPKPQVKAPREKTENVMGRRAYQNVEMKRGDWTCSSCNFMNFARNLRCLECKAEGPKRVSADDVEMKKGDWNCPDCNFMNFARNLRCLECKAEGPKRVGADDVEMKKGDWNCPECQFMNFARNTKCFRCTVSRPKRELLPGEWECPSCDFLNYRRNMACLKCNCDRPKDEVAEYEDQMWRKPR